MYCIETIEHENPQLTKLLIKNERWKFGSAIYPNLGASLQQYSMNGVDVIHGISADKNGLENYNTTFNSAFLFPFFGRIPQGKFDFNNKSYTMECNADNGSNALHGHLYNKPFTLLDTELLKSRAYICFTYEHDGNTKGYPFPYSVRLSYTFTKNRLNIRIGIHNTGNSVLPFGLGWHPYFKTDDLNRCHLDFNADKQLSFNKYMVPDGEIPIKHKTPVKIGDQLLDDGFLLNRSDFVFTTKQYKTNVHFSSDPPCSYLQAYTPPHRESIAIEPLTCAPNCLNNQQGIQFIEPNKFYNWHIEMKCFIL